MIAASQNRTARAPSSRRFRDHPTRVTLRQAALLISAGWLGACGSDAVSAPSEAPTLPTAQTTVVRVQDGPRQAEVAQIYHSPPGQLSAGSTDHLVAVATCVGGTEENALCVQSVALRPDGSDSEIAFRHNPARGWELALADIDVGDRDRSELGSQQPSFFDYVLEFEFKDGSRLTSPSEGSYSVPIAQNPPQKVELGPSADASLDDGDLIAALPWGTGPGEVGRADADESADGGPSGFGVINESTVLVMDYVNGRFINVRDGADSIGGVCVIDAAGRVTGQLDVEYSAVSTFGPGTGVAADGLMWAFDPTDAWKPIVAFDGSSPKRESEPPFGDLGDDDGVAVYVESRGVEWEILTDSGLNAVVSTDFPMAVVNAAQVLDDGRVVVVGTEVSSSPEAPYTWMVAMSKDGSSSAVKIATPSDWMTNGAEFTFVGDDLYVMTGSRSGVEIRRYQP